MQNTLYKKELDAMLESFLDSYCTNREAGRVAEAEVASAGAEALAELDTRVKKALLLDLGTKSNVIPLFAS